MTHQQGIGPTLPSTLRYAFYRLAHWASLYEHGKASVPGQEEAIWHFSCSSLCSSMALQGDKKGGISGGLASMSPMPGGPMSMNNGFNDSSIPKIGSGFGPGSAGPDMGMFTREGLIPKGEHEAKP